MGTRQIEEEPPIDDEILLTETRAETFVESESATDFKGFEALPSLTSTTYCFAPMFRRKLDGCTMNYDNHLRRFNETLTN